MRSTQRFLVKRPKVIHQTIDGETVIINLETGNYYSLLSTGAYVWGLIEANASIRDIVAALAARYEGTQELLEQATLRMLDELQAEGLIVPSERGHPDPPEGSALPLASTGRPERLAFDPPTLEKYDDMRNLILLDPVHEVDEEEGWPHAKSGA